MGFQGTPAASAADGDRAAGDDGAAAGDKTLDLLGFPFAVDLDAALGHVADSTAARVGVAAAEAVTRHRPGPEAGGVLGAVATKFGDEGGSRLAGLILVALLAPALILFAVAAVPRVCSFPRRDRGAGGAPG